MKRSIWLLSFLFVFVTSFRQEIGNAAPKYYDWPTHGAAHGPQSLWSNLGEKRGALGDGPNWLDHGATDFKPTRGSEVYSPDVGTVRFGEDSDKKSGMPPVKIGHFSLLHFQDVNHLYVNPADLGDANRWTVVVRPDDDIQLSSRPEEFHLRALLEPYVNLSIHTAPDVRPLP